MAESKSNEIRTVSDMFKAIQDEIDSVKAGQLPLDTARVVQRGRALQIKAAELNLSFMRLNKAERTRNREYSLLTGVAVDDPGKENKVV